MARHDEKPKRALEVPPDVIDAAGRFSSTPRADLLRKLGESLRGQIVESSIAGKSGYVVVFANGEWLAIFVAPEGGLVFEQGNGAPSAATRHFDHPDAIDGSPVPVSAPYADEWCDIGAEVTKAHGKAVKGIAIGADFFNLCFPEGMELENHVLRLEDGRFSLRVFWEQW